MSPNAQVSVAALLNLFPPARRREMKRIRALIRTHLPAGYEEVVTRRMLVYQVPLARYADTYNRQPLWYVALASEKSYLSLHLMSIYGDTTQVARLQEAFRTAGKQLNMGKACIHFHKADDLPLEVIGKLVASMPVDRWVSIAQAARRKEPS